MDCAEVVKRVEGHDRRVGILALASTVALIASACSSGSPSASTLAATVMPSPAVTATAPSTQAPAATPIPTLSSTTEDATVAAPGAISFKLTEDAGPRFQPDQATAKAGDVVIFLQNVLNVDTGPFDHNMAIGPKLHVPLANSLIIHSERSAVFTVAGMTPGTYTFWCQVEDHATKGMVGTLTITP